MEERRKQEGREVRGIPGSGHRADVLPQEESAGFPLKVVKPSVRFRWGVR